MNQENLEAFWNIHDIAKNRHAENFLRSLIERKREHLAASEKVQKFALVGLLLFWAIAFHQSADNSFAGIKFSEPSNLLVVLMVLLSFANYQSLWISLHAVSIDRVVAAYYAIWLPAVKTIKLDALFETPVTEISLGTFRAMWKPGMMLLGMVRICAFSVILLILNTSTIAWVATRVTLTNWQWIKHLGICLSLFLTAGAGWLFLEFAVRLVIREARILDSKPGAKLTRPKKGALSTLARKIRLSPAGVYKGNARLYAADEVIARSHDMILEFLNWETSNRELLKVVPEISRVADRIRATVPELLTYFLNKRDAFKSADTESNEVALNAALNRLRKDSERAEQLMRDYGLPKSELAATALCRNSDTQTLDKKM